MGWPSATGAHTRQSRRGGAAPKSHPRGLRRSNSADPSREAEEAGRSRPGGVRWSGAGPGGQRWVSPAKQEEAGRSCPGGFRWSGAGPGAPPPPRGKGDGAEQGRRHVTSRRRGECTSPQLPPRQRGIEVSPTTSMAGDEARPDLLLLDAIWRRIKLIRRGEGRCPRPRSWATSPGAR